MIALIDYLKEAEKRYEWLKPYYKDQSSLYWPLGNTLDTMIDFLKLSVTTGNITLTEAQSFLNTAANNYERNGAWYDDWGWWGNATAKVYDPNYNFLFSGDFALQDKFKGICQYCFTFMKYGDTSLKGSSSRGAPNAYNYVVEQANSTKQDVWKNIKNNAEPLWNTGCWQNYMSPDCDPTSGDILGPFQDTVVNALYYILTQRMLTSGYSAQSDIDMMTDYFKKWMGNSLPKLSKQEQIFNDNLGTTYPSGLFRERISKFKNGNALPGYREGNLAWTGDQGLMLSALTLLYKTNKDSHPLELMKKVINGVALFSQKNKIILPWSNQGAHVQPGPSPDKDIGDYSSGTGVFMRGLLHASSIPEIMAVIKSTSYINDALSTTTEQCLSKDGYSYGGDTIFQKFNELATLTAASKLLL